MMLVPTVLHPSPIAGVGVFADADIPAGEVVWEFTPGVDREFTLTEIQSLPEVARRFIERTGYESNMSGKIILCADHGNYFNHSADPNTMTEYLPGSGREISRSIRAIAKGEELTCNYHELTANAALLYE